MELPVRADVVVIGGGPAGATAATLLKRQLPERRIVLLEKARFPRHHVGEALLPESNSVLHKMGVVEKIDSVGFLRKAGATFNWKQGAKIFSEIFVKDFSTQLAADGARIPAYTWQVTRAEYDRVLLENAVARGVEVYEGVEVRRALRDGDRVVGVVAQPEGAPAVSIAADFVIDCSGLGRVLARELGLSHVEHRLGDLAIYRYYEGIEWNPELLARKDLTRTFLTVSPRGWMWFIALSERRASVGLVTRREVLRGADKDAIYEEEIRSVPEVASMLAHASWVGSPQGNGAPRTYGEREWTARYEPSAGPGFYLAGDAGLFVDPLLSSGVMIAHHSAMHAANAVCTEYLHPEIDPLELRRAYTALTGDMWAGFVAMADWWYNERHAGIEDWYKRARDLAGDARGAVALDDITLFLTYISGFLADFRFRNVGVGFGSEGLRQVLVGREDAHAAAQVEAEIHDRSVALERRYLRAEVVWYLATDVDTDRWWRLPGVCFERDGAPITFRPPVLPGERDEHDLVLVVRIVEKVLELTDGRRSVEEVVRATRRELGGNERYVHHMASLTCMELQRIGVFAVAAPRGTTP